MSGRRHAMSWRKVAQSLQGLAAHGSLFTFTLLLVLKLDHIASFSWWFVFNSYVFKFFKIYDCIICNLSLYTVWNFIMLWFLL